MASEQYKYSQVYNGNAAYEVQWQDEVLTPEEPRHAAQPLPRRKRAYGVSVTGLLGVLLAVAAVMFLLVSYASYTAVANQTVNARHRVEELQEENRRLSAAYDVAFDMNAVKSYAQKELGMGEPTSSQIEYAEIESQDSVAIYSDGDNSSSLLSAFTSLFSAIGGN